MSHRAAGRPIAGPGLRSCDAFGASSFARGAQTQLAQVVLSSDDNSMNRPVPTLQARLEQVAARQRRLQLACKLAACWAGAALVGLIFPRRRAAKRWASSLALPITALLGVIGASLSLSVMPRTNPCYHALAAQIQGTVSRPRRRLITASSSSLQPGAKLNFLQEPPSPRGLSCTAISTIGRKPSRGSIISFARGVHSRCAIALWCHLWQTPFPIGTASSPNALRRRITVTPGDTSMSAATVLVVLARFGKTTASSSRISCRSKRPNLPARIPLVKSLADPMFGGSVPEVGRATCFTI